jgi:hypothetical protein
MSTFSRLESRSLLRQPAFELMRVHELKSRTVLLCFSRPLSGNTNKNGDLQAAVFAASTMLTIKPAASAG